MSAPNSDDVFRSLVQEEIKKVTEGEGTTQDTPAPTPQKINIGGQEYTFNNPEELAQVVNNTLGAVGQRIQTLEQELQSKSAGTKVTSDTEKANTWTQEQQEEFIQKMGTNPIEALEYIDKIRYGTEAPSKVIKSSLEEIERLKAQRAVDAFKDQHPEWPGGQAGEVLDKYRQQLGLPFTPEGLSAAYASAQMNGVLPPWTFQYRQQLAVGGGVDNPGQSPFPPPGPPASRGAFAPPPSFGGRNAPDPTGLTPDVAAQLENMSAEQIRKLIGRLGG